MSKQYELYCLINSLFYEVTGAGVHTRPTLSCLPVKYRRAGVGSPTMNGRSTCLGTGGSRSRAGRSTSRSVLTRRPHTAWGSGRYMPRYGDTRRFQPLRTLDNFDVSFNECPPARW